MEAWDLAKKSNWIPAANLAELTKINHRWICFTDPRREGVGNPSTFGRHQAGSGRDEDSAPVCIVLPIRFVAPEGVTELSRIAVATRASASELFSRIKGG